jgi:hypothetical protein
MGMRPSVIAAERRHEDFWLGGNISEAVET